MPLFPVFVPGFINIKFNDAQKVKQLQAPNENSYILPKMKEATE